MKKFQRFTALLVALCLLAALPLNASADIAEPQDVPWPVEVGSVRGSNTAWYANAVYDLYYTGICWEIMDGENIVPGKAMTREEFIILLKELAWYASKDTSPRLGWTPLPEDGVSEKGWSAMNWALDQKIIQGDGQSLAADRPMTRQEMAVILVRFADYMGLELGKTDSYGKPLEKLMPDGGQVSRWAKSAVEEAVWRGLIRGIEHFSGFYDPEEGVHACGIFSNIHPQDTVTRAEGYQAVWNYTKAAGIYLMWRNEFVDWHRWTPP